MITVKNKRILLIGASGVLGSEYANSLNKQGAKLILSDLNNLNFKSVINNNKKAKHLFCNLSNEQEIIRMVKKASKFFGGLDGFYI